MPPRIPPKILRPLFTCSKDCPSHFRPGAHLVKISQHDEVFIGIEEIFAGGASEQNSSLFLFGVIALHHILVVLSFKR